MTQPTRINGMNKKCNCNVELHSGFTVSFTDPRFPSISIVSDGTINFVVMRNKRKVDTFTAFEMAMSKEVCVRFAGEKADAFFNYLEAHQWLLEAYFHRHI